MKNENKWKRLNKYKWHITSIITCSFQRASWFTYSLSLHLPLFPVSCHTSSILFNCIFLYLKCHFHLVTVCCSSSRPPAGPGAEQASGVVQAPCACCSKVIKPEIEMGLQSHPCIWSLCISTVSVWFCLCLFFFLMYQYFFVYFCSYCLF